ncbi:MAG: ADP-ribosylglycohydrolase family protein [Planctomycetes bacterium]|nr:ADP-ribosylglycohydrolase family protein [Planctomycetota bacterium]
MSERKLIPRFVGYAIGSAAGSAVALPYEGYSRGFLASLEPAALEHYEPHRSGRHPRGQYAGDVQNFVAMAEAVIEAGRVDGETIAAHLIPLWRDQLVIGPDPTAAAAMRELVEGRVTWVGSGQAGAFPDNGPIGRAAVVGLWDSDRPQRIPSDVDTVCRITHTDPRTIAAASAYAAAVSYLVGAREIVLGELLDRMAAACAATPAYGAIFEDLPRFLSLEKRRAREEIRDMASEAGGEGNGMPPHALATVLLSILSFLKAPDSYPRAVFGCLREGGDVDTTCFLAGGLVGAFKGSSAVPDALVAGLVDRERIEECAIELSRAHAHIDAAEKPGL